MDEFKVGDIVEVKSLNSVEKDRFYKIGNVGRVVKTNCVGMSGNLYVNFYIYTVKEEWFIFSNQVKLYKPVEVKIKEVIDSRTEEEKLVADLILG